MMNFLQLLGLQAADHALDLAAQAMNKLQDDLHKAREAAETLLRASEANRAFDIEPRDEFKENYPQYSDYENGDIDEVLLEAQEGVREMLKITFDPTKEEIIK